MGNGAREGKVRIKPLNKKEKVPLEDWEQEQVITWAWQMEGWEKIFDFKAPDEFQSLFHVPNGGYRTKREAALLKRTGVKPGVHDLFLPLPRHGMHGCWIEMKRLKGSDISDDQITWQKLMRERNYRADICLGHTQAIHCLLSYFDPEWDMPW